MVFPALPIFMVAYVRRGSFNDSIVNFEMYRKLVIQNGGINFLESRIYELYIDRFEHFQKVSSPAGKPNAGALPNNRRPCFQILLHEIG